MFTAEWSKMRPLAGVCVMFSDLVGMSFPPIFIFFISFIFFIFFRHLDGPGERTDIHIDMKERT